MGVVNKVWRAVGGIFNGGVKQKRSTDNILPNDMNALPSAVRSPSISEQFEP